MSLTFGNTAFSTIYPNIPATIVSQQYTKLSPGSADPDILLQKKRLAINKDTVKPIPPNKDTPATLLQFIPGGIDGQTTLDRQPGKQKNTDKLAKKQSCSHRYTNSSNNATASTEHHTGIGKGKERQYHKVYRYHANCLPRIAKD